MSQTILLVTHQHREQIRAAAALTVRVGRELGLNVIEYSETETPENDSAIDLVLALGGDGTILGAAEHAHALDAPLLGVNFGHLGFLAETSGETIPSVMRQVAKDEYLVDPRMTLDAVVTRPDGSEHRDWALNEAAVLHTDMAHPAELAFAVDGQVVSTYGADGVILATPTGSTAYAYSAGGPIVWPDTEAIVMAPLAAHGLFTRPMVVSPASRLEVGVLEENRVSATVWFDGRRETPAPAGTRIVVTRGARPLKVVRLDSTPFAERIVAKFSLPVEGWRAGRTG